jgi:LPS sulfotransferase NodH
LIPAAQYAEVRYEELVKNPVGSLEQIYETLGIPDFQAALPAIENSLASREGYRTNRYDVDAKMRDQIKERWSDYIDRYGY